MLGVEGKRAFCPRLRGIALAPRLKPQNRRTSINNQQRGISFPAVSSSVQDPITTLDIEFHRPFYRAVGPGLKLPLQERFRRQFVQVLVTSAFYNFKFV